MKCRLLAVLFVLPCHVFAASAEKSDAVADGFPVWRGVVPKNYICCRELTPSDLRHRVVVVMEVEANAKFFDTVLLMGNVAQINPITHLNDSENWETRVLPRHTLILVSVRGGGKDVVSVVRNGLVPPKDSNGKTRELNETQQYLLRFMRSDGVSYYSDVTYQGGPESTGKRPYAYVLGPIGTEPYYNGPLTEGTVKDIKAAALKAFKSMTVEWIPFYGFVHEPKYCTLLGKTLEKGKAAKTSPLSPVSKALMKDILSKDIERSTEAQILYDAIEQTRSDLLLRIFLEYRACPHRAYYDAQMLLKYWPNEKKRLDAVAENLKANPEANRLAQMYCKVMVWADPAFMCKNAGEAKKIVGELNKMRKDLEKLKESKVVVVQNGALLMDAQLDELLAVIPTRLPEK